MRLINYIAVAALLASGTALAQTVDPMPYRYVSVGPVVAGSVDTSSLPSDATKYINKHFQGVNVTSVEKEFLTGRLEVKLSDGAELEFDSIGRITEIDAPDGYSLGEEVIKSILPHRAIDTLKHYQYITGVEKIERNKNGFNVDLNDRRKTELLFDTHGKLIAVDHD